MTQPKVRWFNVAAVLAILLQLATLGMCATFLPSAEVATQYNNNQLNEDEMAAAADQTGLLPVWNGEGDKRLYDINAFNDYLNWFRLEMPTFTKRRTMGQHRFVGKRMAKRRRIYSGGLGEISRYDKRRLHGALRFVKPRYFGKRNDPMVYEGSILHPDY